MSFDAMSNFSQSLILHYFISFHFISFYVISGLELLSKYEKENATHITGGGAGGGGFSSSRPVQGKVVYDRVHDMYDDVLHHLLCC